MDESTLHAWLTLAVFALGAVTLAALFFVSAPYGRHSRSGWGPMIPARVGWVVMEMPSALGFLALYFAGGHALELAPLALLALWQMHYLHRCFIFPFRMRADGKQMPALIAGMAIVFNLLNTYVNARWISELGSYATSWLADPRFLVGAALMLAGFAINVHSDSVLFGLRKPGESGYKIPRGGLYRWVSSPNYLGELCEWCGWALASWSLSGAAFAFYTFANLFPRALSHHRWYRDKFADYPSERRALIPFVL